MPNLQKSNNAICWRESRATKILKSSLLRMQNLGSHFGGKLTVICKAKHFLTPSCSFSLSLLSYHQSYSDVFTQLKGNTMVYMWMFRESSFIISKDWKPPKCPTKSEWINKQCNIIQ